ncbi:hypothetical protein P170DRAFT_445370 [Aspergillus steynii IBT 23096]|uniref:Xylanolytic transcriptional activator regulatory domain-containing protein n=1 Tax=Aspergillus steynii IBT 23096 TaxID=1392250 RepID=A0A2I2GAP2_9EURO|nr:uncharacterized protein P170DRAFT_445370 [Aspergillus steynii IBT 23096]PLB49949.1 hypothetical protein P170DRAFT_445370 [Aspergillus steynii IBT 23096]
MQLLRQYTVSSSSRILGLLHHSIDNLDPIPTLPPPHGNGTQATVDQPSLYIDYLIENQEATGQAHDLDIPFKLGNNGLERVLERVSRFIDDRYERFQSDPIVATMWAKPDELPVVSTETARVYVNTYFSQVHPVYPFLDRAVFEQRISLPEMAEDLAADKHWTALYYTVLALGCQYHGGGAFEPRKGEAWKFYQMALSLFPDIIISKKSLVSVQAIFALNLSYMHIDSLLITEAARIAQSMEMNEASKRPDRDARYRTFWVIYILEKTLAFTHSKTSVIMDCNVGCPIPTVPEAIFGDYNWLLASAGFARIASRAYEGLFSLSATRNSEEICYQKLDVMNELLQRWRQSIPLPFRPGEKFRAQSFHNASEIHIALRTHYYYYDALIALCRLTLQLGKRRNGPREIRSKKVLMQATRSIIELCRHIDMESYTPVYILALLPLTAMFILFDFVVHNPAHSETSSNLALLEVAGGHFSRLEYVTGGSLPSSILAEFAYLARTFVRSYQCQKEEDQSVANGISAPLDTQESTPLHLSSFDNMTPEVGFPPGFNVMDLFGTSVPFDQYFLFDTV